MQKIAAFALLFTLVSSQTCGNFDLEAGEDCDDGNVNNFDGCSNVCMVEKGWLCYIVRYYVNPTIGTGAYVAPAGAGVAPAPPDGTWATACV